MNAKILLVDDEEHMLKLLQFALRSLGAQLLLAKSGERAIELIAGQKPDIVLLDYSMPGMDGVETLRQLRELQGGEKYKVIMLTARDQTAIRKDAEGLNVRAFLTKPFSPVDLAQRVGTLLTE